MIVVTLEGPFDRDHAAAASVLARSEEDGGSQQPATGQRPQLPDDAARSNDLK
jgi:hypothetical protein